MMMLSTNKTLNDLIELEKAIGKLEQIIVDHDLKIDPEVLLEKCLSDFQIL